MIPLYPSSRISAAQIEDLTALVKARPGTSCVAFGEYQLQCNAPDAEVWWLTEPGHPAHPAASRARILTNQHTGENCLVRDGYFAGKQQRPFTLWLRTLKSFDENAVKQP
jgi:hypothetical protein